jgi:hypothetical protein
MDSDQKFIESLQTLIDDLDYERTNKKTINEEHNLFVRVYQEYEKRALNILKGLKNNNSNSKKKLIINDLMSQLAMIYSIRYPEDVKTNNLKNLMKKPATRKRKSRKAR